MYHSRDERVEVQHREVPMDQMLLELTQYSNADEVPYKTEFLRLRLEIVQMSIKQSETLLYMGHSPKTSQL